MLVLWQCDGTARIARASLIAAGALLVLDSAGTLSVGYTVAPSYLLLVVASALGIPQIPRRWRSLPPLVRGLAPALLAVYVVAAFTGQPESLGTAVRGSTRREYVYLFDLAVGLSSMLLVPALWKRAPTGLALAIAGAGAAAAMYAIYQWFAQRFGLPFTDVNNTLDSNGITAGASQGVGLFGAERVRGTFLEPHFLGAFLSTALPLQIWVSTCYSGRRRALVAFVALATVCALILTDSAPDWGTAIIAVSCGALLLSVARGRKVQSRLLGVAVAGLFVAFFGALFEPGLLGSLTGRSAGVLSTTTNYRTHIWSVDLSIWRTRPALGYGPGQSAIRAAYANAAATAPLVPVSAQGFWAAALIDSGIVGFLGWLYLSLAIIGAGMVGILRRPTLLGSAAFAGAIAVVIDIATSGDRLQPRHWLVLGLALAASRGTSDHEAGQAEEQADQDAASDAEKS